MYALLFMFFLFLFAAMKRKAAHSDDSGSSSDESDYALNLQHKQKIFKQPVKHRAHPHRIHVVDGVVPPIDPVCLGVNLIALGHYIPLQSTREAVRKAMCFGLFHNSARKAGPFAFSTMNGNGTAFTNACFSNHFFIVCVDPQPPV